MDEIFRGDLIDCNPIMDYMENHPEYNVTKLAKEWGVSRVTLSRIINRKQIPSSKTIRRIISGSGKEISHSSLIDCYSITR